MSGDQRILDCTSPGFIRRYFATSRLHHLSTWKADLADYVISQMNLNNRSSAVTVHRASRPDEPFRTVMHVDMDCFFASVGVRDRPHLVGKPVAVAHSQGGVSLDYSTSEIASCNYEARAKGVKNGMFIGSAKELAPDLIIIPYEFDKYDSCSKALYHTLLSVANFVQSVSIDEAYIDVSFCVQKRLMESMNCSNLADLQSKTQCGQITDISKAHEDAAVAVANQIRAAVFERTRCHASVGIGANLLLARIATQKAKPNGVFSLLRREAALEHLGGMPIRGLPGVGSSLSEKCEQMHLLTCGDVQAASKPGGAGASTDLPGSGTALLPRLRRELGEKTGENLYNFCWTLDDRVLENKPRQTVGADINWGIRFTNAEQVESFLREFSEEVFARLDRAGHTAKQVTVDVKKKLYEGEPGKFLGCGHCLDLSKSMAPGRAIASADALYRCVSALYKEIGLQPLDVRGIGIHLKKLQQGGGGASTGPGSGAGAGAGVGGAPPGSIAGFFGKPRADADNKQDTMSTSTTSQVTHGQLQWQSAGIHEHREHDGGEDDHSDRESENILEANRKSSQYDRTVSERSGDQRASQLTTIRSIPAESDTSAPRRASNSDSAPATAENSSVATNRQEANGQGFASNAELHVGEVSGADAQPVHEPVREAHVGAVAASGSQSAHHQQQQQQQHGHEGGGMNMGLRMEDIDLDVFCALPEDIQRELQQAFAQRSTHSAGAGDRQPVASGRSAAPPSRSKRAGDSAKTSSGAAAVPSSKRSRPSANGGVKGEAGGAGHNKQGTLDMWRVTK